MLATVTTLCGVQDAPAPACPDPAPDPLDLRVPGRLPAGGDAVPPRGRRTPMLLHEALALAQCRPTGAYAAPARDPYARHRRELLARRRLDLALRRLERATGEVERRLSHLEASV